MKELSNLVSNSSTSFLFEARTVEREWGAQCKELYAYTLPIMYYSYKKAVGNFPKLTNKMLDCQV